jgi:hypothetical protein
LNSSSATDENIMPTITFKLALDKAGNPGNAARLWLDTSRDDMIEPGEEVTLSTIDGKFWVANKTITGTTGGMQFLVKFIAPVGTKWSFTAEVDGTTLHETKGQQTTTSKEALAGSLS